MSVIIPGNVIAFFTGVWGKVALYAIILGILAFGFRLWLNKHDDGIFRQGREQAVQTMTRDYEARLKVELAGAKAMADTAAKDREAVEVRLDELDARFSMIFVSLHEVKLAAEKRQVVYVQTSAAVPASELDNTIRALSAAVPAGRTINR